MSLFLGMFGRKSKEETPPPLPAQEAKTQTRREQIQGMLSIDPDSQIAADGKKFFKVTALKAQLKAVDAKIAQAVKELREQKVQLAKMDKGSLENKDIIRLRTDAKAILGRLEFVRLQILSGSEKLERTATPGTLSEYQKFTKLKDEEGTAELQAALSEAADINLGEGLNLSETVVEKMTLYNQQLVQARKELSSETSTKTKAAALKHLALLTKSLDGIVAIADGKTASLKVDTAGPADREYTKGVASKKLLIQISKIEEALRGLQTKREEIEAEIAELDK